MAFTISSVAAKDGNGTTVGGGLLAADIAGGGAGPFFLFHGLVDGVAGSNKAAVTAANALKVDGSAVVQPVSGTFWQATQPVSIASAVTVAQPTAANLNATVVGTGTFAMQATQAGTWTVQPGNTANTTPWLVEISDGTNAVGIAAASTLPVATQPAIIVAMRPDTVNTNVTNASDAVATSANGSSPVVNYNYGFNGTTWDRLQVDGSKNLKIAVAPSTTDVAVTPTVTAGA